MRTSFQSRASVFARAIRRRYEGRRVAWPLLALVFTRLHLTVRSCRVYNHTQIHLTPHLELTLVQRLIARGERIEAMGAAGLSVGPHPGSGQRASPRIGEGAPLRITGAMAQPVSRVVRRSGSIPVSPEVAPPMPPVRRFASDLGFQTADSGRKTVAFGPTDLNRLTDQVIQAIDRRILAQRERLGRS